MGNGVLICRYRCADRWVRVGRCADRWIGFGNKGIQGGMETWWVGGAGGECGLDPDCPGVVPELEDEEEQETSDEEGARHQGRADGDTDQLSLHTHTHTHTHTQTN